MNTVEHVVYNLRNTKVNTYPFPHFYCEDVFPWDFYGELRDALDTLPEGSFAPLGYEHRMAMDAEKLPMMQQFSNRYFGSSIIQLFGSKLFFDRYPNHSRPTFAQEFRFIRDEEGYSIGPHTDTPRKVLSLLFYLPDDFNNRDCGTGIYVPDDHEKTCAGGPHHSFEGFSEVWRAPFVPNSCFGFWKTPNSWHAVEKISRKIRRDVLLFNIYEEKEQKSPIITAK